MLDEKFKILTSNVLAFWQGLTTVVSLNLFFKFFSVFLLARTRYVIPKSGSKAVKKPWPDARAYCVSLGGDLLSIDDFAEHRRVLNFIENSGVDEMLWIGLNDRKTEGKFEWSDGNPSKFTHWNTKEPNGGRSENCAHSYPKYKKRKWNDLKCSISWAFICKIKSS